MRAVIIEDDFIVADHLQMVLNSMGVSVINVVDNLDDAEKTLSLGIDFYLLDIRLSKEHNGINFGKRLRSLKIPFIYLTANNEMRTMNDAIATEPEAYISKPFKESDVIATVELLRLRIKKSPSILVIGPKGSREILEKHILYCEAEGSYTRIFTENETILQRMTLREIEHKLSDSFLRIHRSYLVNKQMITSQKANAVFIGNIELPISKSYKTIR